MHEAILGAVVGRDEAEALRVVEPLHSSGVPHSLYSLSCVDGPENTKGTHPKARSLVTFSGYCNRLVLCLPGQRVKGSWEFCQAQERSRGLGALTKMKQAGFPGRMGD